MCKRVLGESEPRAPRVYDKLSIKGIEYMILKAQGTEVVAVVTSGRIVLDV